MRVYEVNEYTPQPIGYKLVPFNGMRMDYAKDEPSSFLAVAKSKSELPKPPQGREQAIRFLGYAPSVEAWREKVAKKEEEEVRQNEQRKRDRITRIIGNLVPIGITTEHAQVLAENVFIHWHGKRNFLVVTVEFPRLPTLALWLKERGYSGEQRALVERFLRSKEAERV